MALEVYYNTGDDDGQNVDGVYRSAQIFSPTSDIEVNKIKVKLASYNGEGQVDVYIEDVDINGKPNGNVLASATVDIPAKSFGEQFWQEFTFSPGSYPDLISINDYALVVDRVPSTGLLEWRYDSTAATYTDGYRATSDNDGSTWTIDENSTDFMFEVYSSGATPPSQPTNPTPADGATDVDFSSRQLSWDDGGNADNYHVYVGDSSGSLTLIASGITDTSYTLTEEQRSSLFDDHCYWRVDASNEDGTTTGVEWDFTVAAPGKAQDPTPTHNSGKEVTPDYLIDKNLNKLEWEAPS